MPIPSFHGNFSDEQDRKPRILLLEVKDKDNPQIDKTSWVIVEREETYSRDPNDGTIHEASIRLSYQRLTQKFSSRDVGKGRFEGSYSLRLNAVSLTSDTVSRGAVFLDLPGLKGQRIGTYLMNEIVRWVQQWPDANVNSIELLAGQASDENKTRRNWFYEQFGLVFDYSDVEQAEGRSQPILAKNLAQVDRWKENIREVHMLDYLENVLYDLHRTSMDLETRKRAHAELIAERKVAEERPVRWALRVLKYRCSHRLVNWSICMVILIMVLITII